MQSTAIHSKCAVYSVPQVAPIVFPLEVPQTAPRMQTSEYPGGVWQAAQQPHTRGSGQPLPRTSPRAVRASPASPPLPLCVLCAKSNGRERLRAAAGPALLRQQQPAPRGGGGLRAAQAGPRHALRVLAPGACLAFVPPSRPAFSRADESAFVACGVVLGWAQAVLAADAPLHLREMASLLMRRMLVLQDPSVYEALAPEAQAELKSSLLHLVQVRCPPRCCCVLRRCSCCVGGRHACAESKRTLSVSLHAFVR